MFQKLKKYKMFQFPDVFFYGIWLYLMGTESFRAIYNAFKGNTIEMLIGVRGVGLQVLILMGYLWLTGELFIKKKRG